VLNGERTRRQVLTWEGNRGELKDERPIPLAAGLLLRSSIEWEKGNWTRMDTGFAHG